MVQLKWIYIYVIFIASYVFPFSENFFEQVSFKIVGASLSGMSIHPKSVSSSPPTLFYFLSELFILTTGIPPHLTQRDSNAHFINGPRALHLLLCYPLVLLQWFLFDNITRRNIKDTNFALISVMVCHYVHICEFFFLLQRTYACTVVYTHFVKYVLSTLLTWQIFLY